ncbi:acid protease [Stereum hirsutum FP-91666 SS1]|uniref:acid protease n=1 Tax=Stereum hirsutum (strain FP-91666) TaxID=721885 RepID=UPI00044496AA|nr:acid protease [Stereum hirsutum FP-91666 SS1]EIM85888.1 acid protease [Stereum hirsutum FP-91666 SS1]
MFNLVSLAFAFTVLPGIHAANVLKSSFTSSLVAKISDSLSSTDDSNPDVSASNAALKVVVPVQAGNGQTFNDVLVDTGSSVLWVGAQTRYEPGSNSQQGNLTGFSIGYGAGGASGLAYYDKVTIGSATVNSQIIGASNSTSGFTLVSPIDGILGLGPSGSNGGEITGFNATPTFVESLVSEGSIDEPVFGIYVNGLDSTSGSQIGEGEITFGGVDDSKIDGELTWVPQNTPYNVHWEFNVTSMKWGTQNLVNESTPARTDTGVLEIGLPSDAYFDILQSFPGATLVTNGTFLGYMAFPSNATVSALPSLTWTIGSQDFEITPDKYLIPQGLYSSLNLTKGGVQYSWIISAGFGSYMFGQKWLESFYTAYDMQNHQVGVARLA